MFHVSKTLSFPQPMLQFAEECNEGVPLLGGILTDTRYVWHAKGPCLEVRDSKMGRKIGAWTFGCILKDSNTNIVCVQEIQRLNGMLSLLAVGINCTISGGLLCIFDVFSSKVIRAIQIKDKITTLHVVDSGCEVLNLPGPLRNFDGIISVGTGGGNVFLVDICRQICEETLCAATVRDELCPCQLTLLTLKDISNIEYYKEKSVRDGDHLAIHLNIVLNSSTCHFTLKGPKGDDRIFVNSEEVETSALYYCSQLTSLLVGFNFGAFQLWDLTTLNLIYTSPVCEEHLPVTHFALQEPTDDPKAFCYIWVSYSNTQLYHNGLPFVVMYSLCYESKEYHEGYGFLYQDFQSCSVRFQVELGLIEECRSGSKMKGGLCVALQPICKSPVNKDLYTHDVTGDILALCAISWTVWSNQMDTQTCLLLFDLNQWYKEQMPNFTKWSDCSNYILKINLSNSLTAPRKGGTFIDVKIDNKTLRQFIGVLRLEEHFCPSALSFDIWGLRENDITLIHNEGLQKALLKQVETAGPLCLIRPNDLYRQIISLGLVPLFTESSPHLLPSLDIQRETILNVALEHQLVGWLCKCASEWANGSFSSVGCSLEFLIGWAFQRAVVLKTHCDRYCMPLFDYSQLRLDNNTSILLNSCIRQINNLSVFYSYVLNKLSSFISNLELVIEQQASLKVVSIYFEVLQWLVNVGLLPECHPSTYPRHDAVERVSAPYPVQELTEYYNKKRAQLQLLTKETFISSDSLLFIDNLVNNKCGAELLQKQWQDDGGSGLYPPPSLQSLLRTYLIEGTDISHKHSLIIYLFLDLAMALDQGRYASVITHLIKFPAVFKVSSSIIKITQAFWQLDHGDFTTAMEQLLDPFVLGDDLQPWHHAIAMRSLLLQNQYNFALLYMQVRKPPITNEKDVLTAISLFIANNMLDEAFYFKNQHQNNNEEKLLLHLFNECRKNESLHVLLYRCLDGKEEKAFFKYLKNSENFTSDDLQIFYYLLRSRFVEAFDTHQNSRRKNPESQGLLGQKDISKTDQIVKIFKTLLPDVNKKLVDVIRAERTNLWKEVAKPTPLSVFVHNTTEQVRYKSTVFNAALAKAKHTFNEPFTRNASQEIVTEETPFLKTPTVSRMDSRHLAPIITPRIIEIDENGEELCPSPSKRLKLTPRISMSSPIQSHNISMHSKMLTPIIKRKTSLQKDETLLSNTNNSNVCTPQSILKVRNLVRCSDVTSEDSKIDNTFEEYDGVIRNGRSMRYSLTLLPRKSLAGSYRRPHVQFDDTINLSSSLSDQSVKPSPNNTSLENISADKSLSSKDISLLVSSKNSSTSNTEEVFYSPNSSLNNSSNTEENDASSQQNTVGKDISEDIDMDKNSSTLESIRTSVIQSPRARRSYKRPFIPTEPVRSSPRVNKLFNKEKAQLQVAETDDSAIDSNADKEEFHLNVTKEDSSSVEDSSVTKLESPIRQSPRPLQKIKGRKSLSRQVLEHNAFLKMQSSPSIFESNKTILKETSFTREESIVVEKSSESLNITTNEINEEVINVSNLSNVPVSSHHQSISSSVYKERFSEGYLESDISAEVDFSFSSPKLPESLKMPDSLVKFMESRRNNSEFDQNSQKGQSVFSVTEGKSNEMPADLRKDGNLVSELMEVYEDLSSGAEDIEEVLREGKLQNRQSGEPSSSVDDLSRNVCERSESPQQTVACEAEHLEKEDTLLSDSMYFRNTDSSDLPEAEKGFLGDFSKTDVSILSADIHVTESERGFLADDQSPKSLKQVTEVIEIGSSSDEQESSKDSHSDTSDSKSTEKTDSDEDELNISYERNIHVEENSRSLVDSEDSRISGNSIANEAFFFEPRQNIMQLVANDGNNENELEINSDSSTADWNHSDHQSSDDENNEEVAVPIERQVEENIEENKCENLEPDNKVEVGSQDNNSEDTQEISKKNPEKVQEIAVVPSSSKLAAEEKIDNKQSVEGDEEPTLEIIAEQQNKKNAKEYLEKEHRDTSGLNINVPSKISDNMDQQELDVEHNIIQHESSITKKVEAIDAKKHVKIDNKSKKITADHSTNTTTTEESITERNENKASKPKKKKVSKHGEIKDDDEIEIDKHEIAVTAEVHDSSEKATEEQSSKRVTRRSLAEPSYDVLNVGMQDSKFEQTMDPDSAFTPGRRSRRSRSLTASPSRLSTSSRRSQIVIPELNQPSTSKDVSIQAGPHLKRTRSLSVDEVVSSPRKRSLRRYSTGEKSDDSVNIHKSKGKTTSQLPVITEENNDKNKSGTNSKANSVEGYTSTRRLTRRQASLIKDIKTPSTVTAQDDSDIEKALDVDTIDPIKLLDKEPFHGPPDPDEQKVYEPSSPSNSTTSSFTKPTKRSTRSTSVASDSSAPPTTPKRITRLSVGHVDSPSPTGVRTRTRKISETSSVNSNKSDQHTPPKRSKKKDNDENDSEASHPVSTRSTRSRANSTSSVKSDTVTTPKRKPRNRRLVSTKSNLPEITEEKTERGGSSEQSTNKRTTRKKSTQ